MELSHLIVSPLRCLSKYYYNNSKCSLSNHAKNRYSRAAGKLHRMSAYNVGKGKKVACSVIATRMVHTAPSGVLRLSVPFPKWNGHVHAACTLHAPCKRLLVEY
jgi:hypothetical protein